MITPVTSPDLEPDVPANYNHAYIFAVALTAALGGLMFGYDWVVIGGAELFYEKYFHLTDPVRVGWAMSSALVGALLGVACMGVVSDRFGRKPPLIVSGLLFVITSVGTAVAPDFTTFIINRILGGVAIGLASGLSPLYIAEIAPAAMRGRLVSVNQLTIALGVLLAQVVNLLIARPTPPGMTIDQIPAESWNVLMAWRWMFGVTAVPALVFLVAMFFVPESPRWLVKRGRDEKARSILSRIGGAEYAARLVADIRLTLENETEKVNFRELLAPKMRGILLLGIVLAVFQQWCGINVIFQYGARIFGDLGFEISGVMFSIVITGTMAVVMTFVAIFTVDRWGRRGLMLNGSMGLVLIYLTTGFIYHYSLKGVIPVLWSPAPSPATARRWLLSSG